jgi:hypothetical protein
VKPGTKPLKADIARLPLVAFPLPSAGVKTTMTPGPDAYQNLSSSKLGTGMSVRGPTLALMGAVPFNDVIKLAKAPPMNKPEPFNCTADRSFRFTSGGP